MTTERMPIAPCAVCGRDWPHSFDLHEATPPRTPTWVEPDGTPSEPGEHPHYAIWDHEGRKWDTSDKLTARFTQWDDTVLVVTVDDDDPGDMGEPRTLTDYDDGPTTYVSVRAANRYPPPAEPTLDVERLARALHRSYDRDPAVRRIEWNDLNEADRGMWRRHAAEVAREYEAQP